MDSGGVIHTLLEKKLVVTSGRKSVVGLRILYRTSKDFLVHFGLKDVGELPSLKEFEELAKRALGSDWAGEAAPAAGEAASAPAAATEALPTPSAEAGPAAVEGTSEIPSQPSLGADKEAPSVENVAIPEAAQTTQETAGPASTEAASSTPQETSVPVVEAQAPLDNSVAHEAEASTTEETGPASVEAAPETPRRHLFRLPRRIRHPRVRQLRSCNHTTGGNRCGGCRSGP